MIAQADEAVDLEDDGLTVEEACKRFKGMRFEPMGPTSNPDIPEASSIIDYIARYLEITYGTPRR
mgnify:CR=1 FL=1